MHTYQIEITDTFGGEANYSWVKRSTVTMPELTHYGYDGATNYGKANKTYNRELVRKAKSYAGWSNVSCVVDNYGDTIQITPRGSCVTMFVVYRDQ